MYFSKYMPFFFTFLQIFENNSVQKAEIEKVS